MSNCDLLSINNRLVEHLEIYFGDSDPVKYILRGTENRKNNNKISYYTPNFKPKYHDKDLFIKKGFIQFGNCHLKVCKTKNNGSCETHKRYSFIGTRWGEGFNNSLVSLKKERNNVALKKYIYMKKIDDMFYKLNFLLDCLEKKKKGTFNEQYANEFIRLFGDLLPKNNVQQGGDDLEFGLLLARVVLTLLPLFICAFLIALGLFLSVLCLVLKVNRKIFQIKKKEVKERNYNILRGQNCSEPFKEGWHNGWALVGSWLMWTPYHRYRSYGGKKQSGGDFKMPSLTSIYKKITEQDDISVNTHFFQLKNLNDSNDTSKYFLKVNLKQFGPYRKIKISQIIRVNNLQLLNQDAVKSANYFPLMLKQYKQYLNFAKQIPQLYKLTKDEQLKLSNSVSSNTEKEIKNSKEALNPEE